MDNTWYESKFRRLARAIPSTIEEGCVVAHQSEGFPQHHPLDRQHYDEPRSIELRGRGPGSTFHLTAELKGGLLNGPIGRLVARIIRPDVRKSVNNLVALR